MAEEKTDILTPQGFLSEVMHDPNLEVVMNLFKIPRAFAVSGFGDWSVGKHCFCVAYLALYWGRYQKYGEAQRNRLVVMGLTHDLHEAATGDILPALKTADLVAKLDLIQRTFLEGLRVEFDPELARDLKVLDRIAFLFEIRDVAVTNQEQRQRLAGFFETQQAALFDYARANEVAGVDGFLKEVGITSIP